mgnify:FL=1
MLGYVYLLLAIVLELVGTMCMKQSDGFSNIPYALGTLVSYGVCFYFLSLCLKTVPLNIAYATWGGLGIVLAGLVSFFIFHESISGLGILGIALIVAGVVLCNFFGAAH